MPFGVIDIITSVLRQENILIDIVLKQNKTIQIYLNKNTQYLLNKDLVYISNIIKNIDKLKSPKLSAEALYILKKGNN